MTRTIALMLGTPVCSGVLIAGSSDFSEDSAKGGFSSKGADLEFESSERSRWQFGLNGILGFGVEANFSGLGQFNSPFSQQSLSFGGDRFFDDGFVGVDATGNAAGFTTFFGFDNASQLDSIVGELSLSTTNSVGNGSVLEQSGITHGGIEFFGRYSLEEFSDLQLVDQQPVQWGLGFGFNYQRVSVSNSSLVRSDASVSTDVFDSGPVVVGVTPFAGPFTPAPGFPAISASPISQSNTFIPGGAFVSGNREIDSNIFGFNVGPWFSIPLSQKFNLVTDMGLSLAIAHTRYEVTSTTSIPGSGLASQAFREEETEVSLLVGAYASLSLEYEINDAWAVQTGVRYQFLSSVDIEADVSSAELDFGGAFAVTGGLSYRF